MKICGRIYKITNLINNKSYIGKTKTSLKIRFSKHGYDPRMIITKAIQKYGRENFKIEEIDVAYSKKELKLLEGVYISWFKTLYPEGYNIVNIVNGKNKHSEETIEKMKISQNKPEKLKILSKVGKKHRGKTVKNSICNYIGVHKYNYKYISQICFNNKRIYLGIYKVIEDAAKAYDIRALELFGDDCTLNFPELRKDYINDKITVKRIIHSDKSKSGEEGIYFEKSRNKWRFRWFDKKNNKNTSKIFKTLEEAITFKRLVYS